MKKKVFIIILIILTLPIYPYLFYSTKMVVGSNIEINKIEHIIQSIDDRKIYQNVVNNKNTKVIKISDLRMYNNDKYKNFTSITYDFFSIIKGVDDNDKLYVFTDDNLTMLHLSKKQTKFNNEAIEKFADNDYKKLKKGLLGQPSVYLPYYKYKSVYKKGKVNDYNYIYQSSYTSLPANGHDERDTVVTIYNGDMFIQIFTHLSNLDDILENDFKGFIR